MYAVIATGGKQYRIKEEDILDIERIEGEIGTTLTFDNVNIFIKSSISVNSILPLISSYPNS